jgi:hypothetical protein
VTPSEQEQKQVEVLLASYKEKKSEISRRSALSWTGTAGYLVFVYNAYSVISQKEHCFAWPLGVWIVSATAYLFVYSQFGMIMALSTYIRNHIEPSLKRLSGSGQCLLGESGETFSRSQTFLDRVRVLFLLAFVIAPVVLDGFAIYQGGPCPALAYLMAIGSITTTSLVFGLKMSPP